MLVADIKADTGRASLAERHPFPSPSIPSTILSLFSLWRTPVKNFRPPIPSASSVGKFHMNFLWFLSGASGGERGFCREARERSLFRSFEWREFSGRIACNEAKEQDYFGGKWIYSLSCKYRWCIFEK